LRRIHSKHGGGKVTWLIEQRDVGRAHLLAGLVEHRISNEDVGLVYTVNEKGGDTIDFAPLDVVLQDDVPAR